jgi:hypothetical protein
LRSNKFQWFNLLFVAALACLLHRTLLGQGTRDTTILLADSTRARLADSARISPIIPRITAPDSVKAEKKGFQSTKTPMLALGLSAVVPGAGQIYDESYWKVPIIWGLGGYWVYEYVWNNGMYKDYQDRYLQSLAENPNAGNRRYKDLRDFYRDERDKFGWYIGVLYIANILDAYIAAHLYDFDVSPNLGEQNQGMSQFNVKLRYRF